VPSYYLNEAAFSLPDLGFVDRTVNVLEARLGEGAPVGLIIARQLVPPGKTLRQLAIDHLRADALRLSGFAVIEEKEAVVARVPAIDVRSRWRHDGSVLLPAADAPRDAGHVADVRDERAARSAGRVRRGDGPRARLDDAPDRLTGRLRRSRRRRPASRRAAGRRPRASRA
jgi:hypothetical protein